MTSKFIVFGAAFLLSEISLQLSVSAAETLQVEEATVIAQRLNQVRNDIQPQIGASTYTIPAQAIDAQPGGGNNKLNQVLLQAPGVAQDSFGQLHIRGEHNNLQYRLNGIIIPEGISIFGQTLSPRLADKVELITGVLPAEYGLRTAGVVDIETKQGAFDQGGEVGIYGGSHGLVQPSFEMGGSSGQFNYFVTGNYLQSNMGIESPDGRADPLHDRTEQGQGFGYFEDIIDESHKVSLIAGTSREQFKIPDQSGQTPGLGLAVNGQSDFASAALNENQREMTHYGILSYLQSGDTIDFQVSLFGRYSSLLYTPDAVGDLLFNGVSQSAYKRDIAGGMQDEGVYHLNDAHTLRAGLIVEGDRGTSAANSQVLPVDAMGTPTSDMPMTIQDNSGRTAWTYSTYLQDEWKMFPTLTFNYGARLDVVDAYDHATQLSPRANLVWQPYDGTTIHGGYARYLTPPPFELVGTETVSRFAGTSAAAAITTDTTPRAERSNYYDIGVSQKLLPSLTIGVDTYYKRSSNLIDEGQFGAPVVLTPFNYASGKQYGAEATASYQDGPLSAYANFAASTAIGRNIVSSQFNFSGDDLAYIAQHYIHLDHDQTYTVSAGAAYQWHDTRLSGDLLYGSGLRADGDTPNSRSIADYEQVNLSVTQDLHLASLGKFTARFDVINVFDQKYEIRDGTGVGVGAPQFGQRRGFFVGLAKRF